MTPERRDPVQDGLVDQTLVLFDRNVAWLAERGRGEQWGEDPWTGDPAREHFVRSMLTSGEVWTLPGMGELPGGVLVLGPAAPAYVVPADEPERYVHLLIADPRTRGTGVGSALLRHARTRAGEEVALLRVDCFAGGDGRLVEYYEAQGFSRTVTFTDDGWPGQVLELRLSP